MGKVGLVVYWIVKNAPGGEPGEPLAEDYNNPINWETTGWNSASGTSPLWPTSEGQFPYIPSWDPGAYYTAGYGSIMEQYNTSGNNSIVTGPAVETTIWNRPGFSIGLAGVYETGYGFGESHWKKTSYWADPGATELYVGPVPGGAGLSKPIPLARRFERSEYTEVGNAVEVETDPAKSPRTRNDYRTRPNTSVVVIAPGLGLTPGVGTAVGSRPVQGVGASGLDPSTRLNPYENPVHVSRPAPQGTKERKFIANVRAASFLGRVLNFTTESMDMVTAVWEAIPPRYRASQKYSKKKGKWVQIYQPLPQEKMKELWQHFDKVDVNEAIKNIAVNQLEDAAIGKLGAAAQKHAKPVLEQLGRPVGFGTGPAL